MLLTSLPARAEYGAARAVFAELPQQDQAMVVLGLIASGDFEAITRHGFSMGLYAALRRFEQREGFPEDGLLDGDQLQRLTDLASRFENRIGARYYTHPDGAARLLVPRRLFDAEKQTPEGLLFTRRDGHLSLMFISFPARERSYEQLWRSLSAGSADKTVIYQRRFDSRFVVTGRFRAAKFYTIMMRTGQATSGFTFSWGAPMEELGRKVSTFLANAFLSTQP